MRGGITQIFDGHGKAPKALAAMTTPEKVGPLTIFYYIDGADTDEYDYIGKAKKNCIGIKISIDLASTPITPQYAATLDRLYQIAAQENLVVTVSLAQGNASPLEQKKHAYMTVVQALALAEKYSNQVCLQHLRTLEEITLLKDAKNNGILAYGEVACPHLFISNRDVSEKTNDGALPFLPSPQDQEVLWAAVKDGTIDMIGTGNSLTTPELFLPLLIGAIKTKGLKLETITAATRVNIESIFRLPQNNDLILVDLETTAPFPATIAEELGLVEGLKKLQLTGWSKYTIASGEIIPASTRQ
jgi:dihydroorotase